MEKKEVLRYGRELDDRPNVPLIPASVKIETGKIYDDRSWNWEIVFKEESYDKKNCRIIPWCRINAERRSVVLHMDCGAADDADSLNAVYNFLKLLGRADAENDRGKMIFCEPDAFFIWEYWAVPGEFLQLRITWLNLGGDDRTFEHNFLVPRRNLYESLRDAYSSFGKKGGWPVDDDDWDINILGELKRFPVRIDSLRGGAAGNLCCAGDCRSGWRTRMDVPLIPVSAEISAGSICGHDWDWNLVFKEEGYDADACRIVPWDGEESERRAFSIVMKCGLREEDDVVPQLHSFLNFMLINFDGEHDEIRICDDASEFILEYWGVPLGFLHLRIAQKSRAENTETADFEYNFLISGRNLHTDLKSAYLCFGRQGGWTVDAGAWKRDIHEDAEQFNLIIDKP